MTNFCLISDLHCDTHEFDYSVLNSFADKTDIIVVAGDLANSRNETMKSLVEIRRLFRDVLFVPGNHDLYGTFSVSNINRKFEIKEDVADFYQWYAESCVEKDILFLHRKSIMIEGVNFVGATAWHDFNWKDVPKEIAIKTWYRFMPDAGIVWGKLADTNKTVEILLNFANEDAQTIESLLKKSTKNVVVTHHVPHIDFILDKPHDLIWNYLNGSFYSSVMEEVIMRNNDLIDAVCFGHTHTQFEKMKQNVSFYANPRGYPGENPGWSPVMVTV